MSEPIKQLEDQLTNGKRISFSDEENLQIIQELNDGMQDFLFSIKPNHYVR